LSSVSEDLLAGGPELHRNERPIGLSSSIVYLVTIGLQLVGYISTFFIAKEITLVHGSAEFAVVGFVQFNLLLATSVNMLGDLRLGSAFTFFLARGRPARQYSGTYILARAVLVSIAGASLLLIAPVIGLTRDATTDLPSSVMLASLGVFLVFPLLWSPGIVYTNLHIGLGDSIRAQIPTLAEVSVRTPALVASALLFPSHGATINPEAIWALTASYLAGASTSFGVSLPAVWKYIEPPSRLAFRTMLAYAWPLLGSLGLSFLVSNALPIFARAFWNSAAVTILNAANGFRILLLALPAAIVVPLFPHLSGLHVRREFALIRDRVWKALRYTAILVLPLALLIVVYRVNLLFLLYRGSYAQGADPYGGAALPMAFLAFSAIPLSLSTIIGTALNSIGQQRLELYLTALQVAVLFGSAFVLVENFNPTHTLFGLYGLSLIAISAIFSSVAALGLNGYFIWRRISLKIQWRPVLTLFLAAIAEFLVLHEYNTYVPVSRGFQFAAGIVLALVVYSAVLLLVGEISKEDMRVLVHSLGMPDRVGRALSRLCWREERPAATESESPGRPPC
jgi:O-antigen/teichoic acid export membrane protein